MCSAANSLAVSQYTAQSTPPNPHPSTLQKKKKERKKSVSCEFRMSFSFTASCFTCPARCFSCKQKTGRLEQQRWDTAQCFTLSFKEENCCFECSVWWVRVQMHWESSGCYSESFQDPLFSLPPPRPPLSLFFPWHFHIRPCGSWSNPLLCQSSCSPLWPGSTVEQLVFISVGERQGSVSSPLPLQMCLDQGEVDYALCVL